MVKKMEKFDLANAMESNLKSTQKIDSSDFKLKIVLELLDKAASCFEKAKKPEMSEKVVSLMEKLSSKV